MTVKIKGIKVQLGEREFVVPPLNFRALSQLQERLGNTDMNKLDDKAMGLAIDVAMASLKRNYDDVTEDYLMDNLDVSNMQEFMEAAMDVSGMKRKAVEQAGRSEDPPSIGTSASLSS